MTDDTQRDLIAKCCVAMAEVDYDLAQWGSALARLKVSLGD